jgi:hypothetical protein
MSGGRRPTTAPSLIRSEPSDGMISASRSSNSRREIRYSSLTLAFVYLVMVSLEVNGKGLSKF